jgi:8-oxo-dGTP pyrophosphatase MutT (NUDIX family)
MSEKNPWTILSQHTIHENPWIRIEHYDVLTPSGTDGIYDCVDFKNWAIGIVPIDADGNTYIVGQYRFPLEEYSWEIPEGGGNKAATPLASAQRELLEETGITANNWQLLYEFNTSNSVTNEHAFIFLATDLQFGEPEPEETEQLVLKKIPFKQLLAMVYNNEVKDSLTVIGTLIAAKHLQISA